MLAMPTSRLLSIRRFWSISSPSQGRWLEEAAMFPPLPNPSVQNTEPRFSDQDLVRRSASTIPPSARQLTPVAKLIDVSKCIGCKACQSACLEWNDLRQEVGFNHGVYDNPLDLTPEMFTVMR